MSVDDEVFDKDWTPNADYDEENSSTGNSNEDDKTLDDGLEEEEEGLTMSQATKQCGRSKVKRKEKKRKTHTAADFDNSDDQINKEVGGPISKEQINLQRKK